MIRRTMALAVFASLWCAFSASSASAASMNWGDFVGNTITYENVTEDNGEPALLFQMPSIAGDTLEFDPDNFLSEVDPGPGTDIVDSQISTRIEAHPGFGIQNVMISEAGDYTLVGIPGAFGEATVGAAFFFEVLEVDGVLVGDGPLGNANMVFTSGSGPNGGRYNLPGDTGTAVIWEGSAFIDVNAHMAASKYAGQQATAIRLSFNNTLTTGADASGSAFIKKKEIGGIIIEVNIPEPSTIAMVAGLALAGFVVFRRRR